MTYCVALALEQGLIMLADTRTNAGLDNIAVFSKLSVVEVPGERVIAMMSSGNLGVTQAVVHRVIDGVGAKLDSDDKPEPLHSAKSMLEAAAIVGQALREVFAIDGRALQAQNYSFDATFLLGGQIAGGPLQLFQIYSAGNFIESTPDTPYLQIGENKYGKPILDRVARYQTPLDGAIKLSLISLDSTLRSNLTVGMPADLFVCRRNALRAAQHRRITDDDSYFRSIRQGWSDALRAAYQALPEPPWDLS